MQFVSSIYGLLMLFPLIRLPVLIVLAYSRLWSHFRPGDLVRMVLQTEAAHIENHRSRSSTTWSRPF